MLLRNPTPNDVGYVTSISEHNPPIHGNVSGKAKHGNYILYSGTDAYQSEMIST